MKPIGIAVVGASGRSGMIFNYVSAHPARGFITGVFDIIPERSRFYLDEFDCPEAVVYESLEQAVRDPRADAVFVAPTDEAHVEPAVAALKAGKHVFCEKPLAIKLEGCDAVAEAAAQSPNLLYVGMNLRHAPMHDTMHRLVAEGRLGRLTTIEANEYYDGGKTYFRRWNRLRKHGGGLWITKACHDFDILNWFAGGRATRVSASSSLSYYRPRPEAGTHCRACPVADDCPDRLDLDDPGVKRSVRLRMLSEKATGQPVDLCLWNSDKDTFDNGVAVVEYDNDVRATYTVNVLTAISTRQLRLVGTEGTAEGDMRRGTVTYWRRHTGETFTYDLTAQMKSGHGGADARLMRDFFRCAATGDAPRSGWRDGRASVELGLAARQSCDTGVAVDLPL